MTNNLDRKIQELELSIRVMSVLLNNGTTTVGLLVNQTESDLLRLPNFGRKSLNEIREVLSGMSLKLGMTEDEMEKDNPKMPDFFKKFNYDIIAKSKEVAEKSLKHIINKDVYKYRDIAIDFAQHRKVMDFYEKALKELF